MNVFWNIRYLLDLMNDHLAHSEDWTPTQTKVFDVLYNTNIPILGNPWRAYADAYYGSRKAEEYRERYGIKGGGRDPRILAGMSGSALNAFSGGLNYVSKNLESLYRDKPEKKPRHMSYEMAMDLYFMGLR